MSFREDIAALVEANSYGALANGNGWPRVPLGQVAKVINGFAFKSACFSAEEGTPLVRIRDVVEGRSGTRYAGPVPDGYAVEDGDFLVGMDGDFNCAHWRGGPALLNQRVCKIAPDETRLRSRFLGHVLPAYLKLINDHTSSVTVKHLSSRTLQALPIPLPDLEVQDAIVARIDAMFAEIGEAETALIAVRDDVEAYGEALLKSVATGALTADWRANNGHEETGESLLHRILADRQARWAADPKNKRRSYSEVAAPDLGSLPSLPTGWAWTTVECLTTGDRGAVVIGPFGSDLKVSDYTDEGVPLVFVRHIRSHDFVGQRPQCVSPEKAATLKAHEVIVGDLLITKMGDPPGDVAIYPDLAPAIITADCIRWRPHPLLNNEFLAAWIMSFWGQAWIAKHTKGVAQQKITLENFKSMPVAVPGPKEQSAIVAAVKSGSNFSSDIRSLLDAASVASLRQSILAAAFRGDLVA